MEPLSLDLPGMIDDARDNSRRVAETISGHWVRTALREHAVHRDQDVLISSIGGAGSSLLGNIVLELGLHCVDLNKERLP